MVLQGCVLMYIFCLYFTFTHTHTNRSTGRHTNNNKQYLTSFGGGKLGLVLTSGCADNNPLLSRLTIPHRAADLNPHFSPPPPPPLPVGCSPRPLRRTA